MLRTNSKKVYEKIDNYIIDTAKEYIQDQYTDSNGAYYINDRYMNIEMINDLFAVILDIFSQEYLKHNKQYLTGRVSRYAMFKEWASGLALGSTFLYYYNVSAVDLLGDILEQTTEERNKYTEEQAEELTTQLIYRRLTTRADYVF